MKYQITHKPLSVGSDGVLAYPQLSRYYAIDVDSSSCQVDATLRQLELATIRATVCEVYSKPWGQIERSEITAFIKVLKHMAGETTSKELKAQIGLVEHRVFELSDGLTEIRLGSCVCSDCGSKSPELVHSPLKIKNCLSPKHLKCQCGAVAMVDQQGLLVGTLTSEFSWITRVQCINIMGNYKARRLYTEQEAMLFLSNQPETIGRSVFQLNPLNKRSNKATMNALVAFGQNSQMAAEMGYLSDKQTAKAVHATQGNNRTKIATFLKKVQQFEASLTENSCPTIESLRHLCRELGNENYMD